MMLWRVIAVGVALVAAVARAEPPRAGWPNEHLRGTPEPRPPYTVERLFDKLELKAPMYVAPLLETNDLLVILQGGEAERPARIVRFANEPDADAFDTVLETPGRLLYGLTFHPRFAENGYVFVFSNGPTPEPERRNRVARYTLAGQPPRLDPASELVILEWSSAGHDGGDLAFGNDGLLYISAGDGSSDSDTFDTGQNLSDLLGAVLRIDVDHPADGLNYSIPADNPFVGVAGARGEIWAYGLRNPWRLDLDRVSGDLWVGNNGQDLWETAHLVRRGDNLGWSVYEGSHAFYLHRTLGPTPPKQPTIEHSHADFRSLTGGVVYRGFRLSELDGAYVYGDYATGKIWGARHKEGELAWWQELADTALQIAAFRVDQRGELLVVDHGGGIYRLVPQPPDDAQKPFPQHLSETGLFDSTAEHRPHTGLIAYRVNAAGWADGATAERHLALPADAKIGLGSRGWNFDDGVVLVQTLSRGDRRLETRLLVKNQGEWAGYSYRWNEEQTDAALVPKEGADGPGWRFPSRAECLTCHSRAANFVLGISTAQINLVESDGRNQLARFKALGVFREPPSKSPDELPRIVDPHDASQPLEARARSYLHANCSTCHVSAGGGNARLELENLTKAEEMNLLEARPQHDTFGIADAMLVAPGDPERSVLVRRLARRGRGQMPPLVTQQVDERAVELFREWIATLTPKRAFVRAWTMDELRPSLARLDATRSTDNGARLYRELGCAECHRRGAAGGSVGPDLSDVGDRLNAEKLLESLVEPSATVAEAYASVMVSLDDGRTLTGRIEREDGQKVVLRVGPGEVVTLDAATIVERGKSAISNMPAGMLNTAGEDEILDLIAALREKPKPAAP